jgi:hypothetical protein
MLIVSYTTGGTATLSSDYTVSGTPGQVTIPAGQTAATIVLHSIADHVKERNETASLLLTSGSGYKLPKRPKAVVTIVNAP